MKYVDSIRYAEELFPGIQVVELFNQYAIVTIGEEELKEFSALPEVVYVELPKRVYYNLQEGRRASCLSGVQGNPNISGIQGGTGRNLTGRGVFVGIVDSGERVIILSSQQEPSKYKGFRLLSSYRKCKINSQMKKLKQKPYLLRFRLHQTVFSKIVLTKR